MVTIQRNAGTAEIIEAVYAGICSCNSCIHYIPVDNHSEADLLWLSAAAIDALR